MFASGMPSVRAAMARSLDPWARAKSKSRSPPHFRTPARLCRPRFSREADYVLRAGTPWGLDRGRRELRVERIALHQRAAALQQTRLLLLEVGLERTRYDLRDLAHVVLDQASCRQRGRPDPQPRRVHGRALVEGDGIPVDGDPHLLQPQLGFLPEYPCGGQVAQHQVHVGSPVRTSTPPATSPSPKARAFAIGWRC